MASATNDANAWKGLWMLAIVAVLLLQPDGVVMKMIEGLPDASQFIFRNDLVDVIQI